MTDLPYNVTSYIIFSCHKNSCKSSDLWQWKNGL